MNLIKRIFAKKVKKEQCVIDSVIERFEVGDKVGLADHLIENEFMAKMVYEVESKDVSIWQGVRLNLHCGTSLWANEAKKLPRDTPLRT